MPSMLPSNPSGLSAARGNNRVIKPAVSAARVRVDDPSAEGIDWHRISSALGRYRWVILLVTAAATGAAAMASRYIKPAFSAQATIWIDEDVRRGADKGPMRGSQSFEPEAWLDLLRTYAVLDSVVHDLRLNVSFDPPIDPAAARAFASAEKFRTGHYRLHVAADGRSYALSEKTRGELERGTLGDSIGRKAGFLWAPPASAFVGHRDVDITIGTLRDAARSLGEALQAHIDPEGNFLRIELEGTDPARLAATLNDVAGRYVALASDLRGRKLTELSGTLANQRDLAHKSLTDAEEALAAFREKTATLPRDAQPAASASAPGGGAGADPLAAGYFDEQRELDAVRQERATLQRFTSGQNRADVMIAALERLPSVQKSSALSGALKDLGAKEAELRALRLRYSDAFPAVQKLQDDIGELQKNTIPPVVEALASQLAAREAELSGSVAKTASGLRAIPRRSTDETRLRRNVASAENLYNTLQARADEARVAESSTIPDVRVLDPAVMPQRPVKNTAPRIIFLALIGSLGLASIGAVMMDKTDSHFRYPTQVSDETGLTILGLLPHVRRRHREGDSLQDPMLHEALRAIRLNLGYVYGSAGPLVVTISSPGSAEGKSFLTANLGRVFAGLGKRTLLVDGDLRRGSLHRRLGTTRHPGLGDYLRGDSGIDQVIRHTQFTRLDLIACGTRSREAPELLGAEAMSQLLSSVRSRYDVVLCDSPPLSAGVDPLVLGAATGSLLLVLRTGVSHRELTEAKLGVISLLPIRMLGTVMNDVPDEPAFGYYLYSLPEYEARDERAVLTIDPSVPV